ncbi:MAG TPA: hypothetical protein PK445_01715 [Methanolinea sp.]|jgi:hypothetical protein|nr:hypothetical protein [Methanolinea sp.]HPC54747.1 hypothetical protein [Methanolinea sp.]HQE86136.1 hypothetical protein [Methanolinea sp.]HQI13907.1 hypothetical protein [Methanolinea sp.]HQJ18042.1 hypothetical protein [Methanolinea sp.]
MKVTMKYSWQVKLGIFLVFFSFSVYFLKFIILGDPENTYFYVFNALGFLPINVLLVTLVLNELLSTRARRERLEKLNMVIGTFFSEMGTDLLHAIARKDPDIARVADALTIREEWSDQEFERTKKVFSSYPFRVLPERQDLESMRAFLKEKRNFLLRLLENPMLLEHQTFTELLRAVTHLGEELARREDLRAIPDSDVAHLQKDTERVYRLLCFEWLAYMHHLKRNYPYLFSLAIRTNPFDPNARVIVGQ